MSQPVDVRRFRRPKFPVVINCCGDTLDSFYQRLARRHVYTPRESLNMPVEKAKRILSIQSSVCSGYVGNRAATFPLQLLGYDVSCINTVQFSTHTGYPTIKGQKLSKMEMTTLFEGLKVNQVDCFTGLLTGYVPGAEGIDAISEISQKLKRRENESDATSSFLFWVLDPVMGDEERGLYVSDQVPAKYRALMSHADIITPNQFELQVLAESPVTDPASLQAACEKVHGLGVQSIVVTTYRDPAFPDEIFVVGSHVRDGMFQVSVPFYARPYQGTGDLFAALLLAYSLRGMTLKQAVLTVLDSMRPVLERTGQVFDEIMQGKDWKQEKAQGRGATVCQACELRIIECADSILSPQGFFTAKDFVCGKH